MNASNFTGDDLKTYNEVKKEVEWEKAQGEAFLEGFTNPNFMEKVKGGVC